MAQTSINPEEVLAQLAPQEGTTEAQQAYVTSLGDVPEIVAPEYQAVPEVAIPEREAYQRQRYGSRWATFLSRLAHARAGMQDPTISWEQRQNELAKLHAAEQNEIINRALQQQQAERLRRQELNRQAEQQAGLKTAQSAQGVEARQKRTGAEVEFEQGARQQKIDYVKTAAALEKTRKGEFNADTYKQLATSYDTLLQDPEVVQAADDLMRIANGTADVEAIRRAGAGGFKYQQARDLLTLQQALQQMIPSVMQQQASASVGGAQTVQPPAPQFQQGALTPAQIQQVSQQIEALNIDPFAKELLTEFVQTTGSAPTPTVAEAVAAISKALAEAKQAIDQLPVTDASKAVRKQAAEALAREGSPLTMQAIEERVRMQLPGVQALNAREASAADMQRAMGQSSAFDARRRREQSAGITHQVYRR